MWFCIFLFLFLPIIVMVLGGIKIYMDDYKKKRKREWKLRWIFSFIYIVICIIYYYTKSVDLFAIMVVPFLIVFYILLFRAKRKDKIEYQQESQPYYRP